jgi:hypothetical protein
MTESLHEYLDRLLEIPTEWRNAVQWALDSPVKHVKKVPGGENPSDSFKILGFACTGRLGTKRMARRLPAPRVLLLGFPLELTLSAYVDINAAMEMETNLVRELVDKICRVGPSLVVTRHPVSLQALEMLESRGVCVVLNVKPSVMTTLAKLGDVQITTNPDQLLQAKLLHCSSFHVETFIHPDIPLGRKTLLFFHDANFGSSIVVRGANLSELTRIKKALKFIMSFMDSLGKEKSLLQDLQIASDERFVIQDRKMSSSPSVVYASRVVPEPNPETDWSDYNPIVPDLFSFVVPKRTIFSQELEVPSPSDTGAVVQEISILSSLVSTNLSPCHAPEAVVMKFYGRGDVTLGEYLGRIVAMSSEVCKECEKPLLLHFTTLSHAVHQLKFSTRRASVQPARSVWMDCPTCQIAPSGKKLDDASLMYSMGKFLELAFHHSHFWPCSHTEFAYCFQVKDCVVKIQRDAVQTFDVVPPPLHMEFDPNVFVQQRIQEANALKAIVNRFYDSVLERLKMDEIPKGIEKCTSERTGVLEAIDNLAPPTWDTLALTPIARKFSVFATAWDLDFGKKRRGLSPVVNPESPRWELPGMKWDNSSQPSPNHPSPRLEQPSDVSSPRIEVFDSLERQLAPPSPSMDRELVSLPKAELESDSDEELVKPLAQSQDKGGLIKTLAGLLTGTTPVAPPLQMPFIGDHITTNPVVVREDEPSSLVAFALASTTYRRQLKTLVGSIFQDKTNLDQSDMEKLLKRGQGTHMKIQFEDGIIMTCELFFSEQFDALRRCCGIRDQLYIQSLSRCTKWESMGGKSGSSFYRTLDKRFILKQLSKPELDAFTSFAPAYFQYLAQVLFEGLPTTLAKLVGVYRVEFRKRESRVKFDFVVLENLFYNRKMKQIFDLKGSMRNRLVNSTGKSQEVLMDENLVQLMHQSPLYIKQHDKKLVTSSVWNDTIFLSTAHVMDYSLLLGIDRTRLVFGIIDFIRTFTWDKKLESWVKDAVASREPTIISPKQYQQRFREAMDRYFLVVPDIL